MKIAFIGFGNFGQALASVLEKNKNNKIFAWDVADTGSKYQVKDISMVVEKANLIIFCVPSAYFAGCVNDIVDLPQHAILMSGTKGIDSRTGKLPVEILSEKFVNNEIAVLSGPMLATELEQDKQTFGTVATKNKKVFDVIETIFENTIIGIKYNSDIIGINYTGVLKNIYTLLFGLSDGLNRGANFKACLVLLAINEMEQIIEILGGKSSAMMTYAGIGDLLATGYSSNSRNYQYGFAIGRGKEVKQLTTVEGIKNIQNIILKLPEINSFPLLRAIENIFLKNIDANERLLKIFKN